MATIATIWVKLGLDSKDYEKGLKNATQNTKTADQKLSKGLAGGIGQFAAIAGAATAAAAVIWDFTQTASDLEESINKVNVVFGDSAKEIQDWSMDTATSMGISRQAALEAVGTYGNLFTSLGLTQDAASDMSRSLVGLAADMASFNNANPEDVLMALRSGLSGEIEPLKKFGIAMNEVILKQKAMQLGLGDNIQALTEAEKIQVRYAVIMDQTANAQGDFARTSDGLANTLRILNANWDDLKAVVGEEFLPSISELATDIKNLTIWIKDNIDTIKQWANVLGWVTAFPAKFGQATGKLIRDVFGLNKAVEETADSVDPMVTAVETMPPAFEEAADASKELEDALKAQTKVYQGLLDAASTINSENERFATDEANRAARLAEIADEKIRLQLEQSKVQAAGNLTLEKRNDFVRQQIDLDNEANQIAQDGIKAQEDLQKAANQRIFDMVTAGVSADNLSSAEFQRLQDLQVQLGLVTRADADRAIQERASADAFIAAISDQTNEVETLADQLFEIPKNSPYRAQIIIETIGGIPTFGGLYSGSYTSTPSSGAAIPLSPVAGPFGFASGIDNFTVPPGFPNDSFMAGFSSGEVLNVTPASGGSSGSGGSVVNNWNITGVVDKKMVNYLTQEVTKAQTE